MGFKCNNVFSKVGDTKLVSLLEMVTKHKNGVQPVQYTIKVKITKGTNPVKFQHRLPFQL